MQIVINLPDDIAREFAKEIADNVMNVVNDMIYDKDDVLVDNREHWATSDVIEGKEI